MLKWFFRFFKSDGKLKKIVEEINAQESTLKNWSDEGLKVESERLKDLVKGGSGLDDVLSRAFALARETARRVLGQRHFDVQLWGGIVLHQGKIAEMSTGEGKTLAATAPVYLNALSGKGVHVVTVNEYLAKRDTVWMGQIYHFLGMRVACLIHDGALMYDPDFHVKKSEIPNPKSETNLKSQILNSKHEHKESALLDKERDTTGGYLVQTEYLRPISRREAYLADITYGTNHEFGFDYLRDNLVSKLEDKVQRQHFYAIIDEVDSILIDEARTPLIISAPDAESSGHYKTFARMVTRLEGEKDYIADEKHRAVEITQEGIDKVEKTLNIKDLYGSENLRLAHYLQESLKAKALFTKDKDYVVKDGEIILVDQFTGRLLPGRRYSGGLHQAIEAKEGLNVQNESKTYASISIQNYFRLYSKLAGMTGTAQTSAEEFDKVYKLETVTIPTNQMMIRTDLPDLIYKNLDAKYDAIIQDVKTRTQKGQPVLIGTVSIEKNEELARRLRQAGIPHEILNAKNHEREGAIIAQAGKAGAVTVATNMAGRGVDIILGGNPPLPSEARKVREGGGLHVIGTERHESRRIDNQLRGRAGRQGDAGFSQFYLSLEDDLMRIFGGEKIKGMMEWLKVPDDMPIESRVVSKAVGQAQSRVEGLNFDARKHLLDYDDVLNKQRVAIYSKRQALLENRELRIMNHGVGEQSEAAHNSSFIIPNSALPTVLGMLDFLWMNHLENMEALADSVRLRAYGQHDPLVEYRREGSMLFRQLSQDFDQWIKENQSKLKEISNSQLPNSNKNQNDQMQKPIENWKLDIGNSSHKVGRNAPCPCGSGKKYKRCHGK